MSTAALLAPAVARNREPILQVLRDALPTSGLVLEVASGTGGHAAWFSAALPALTWQPTDQDPFALASIAAWREEAGLTNLLPPLMLDAARPASWPISRAEAVVAINMVHIAPWSATEGLFAGASIVLPVGGVVVLYGPFREPGVELASGNVAFDADLKARDPRWGLRDLEVVSALAAGHGFELAMRVGMPANNISVVFRKAA